MLGSSGRPLGAVAVAAVALVGCWPAPGQGPDRQSHNAAETVIDVESVAALDEAWTAELGAGVGAPIVSPSGVHARAGSILHTLDASDGGELWSFDGTTPVPTLMSDPIWWDGQVFVGYGYGNLGGSWEARSFDADTGEAVRELGGGLVDSLRGRSMVSSSVGFGSGGPIVVDLAVRRDLDDPATGWRGVIDAGDLSSGVTRVPATAGAHGVYHTGRALLTTTPGDPSVGNGIRMFDYDRPPSCYAGSTPYLPCPTWATGLDGSTATSPVIGPGEDTLYTGTDAGTVYAVDVTTGAVRWTASVGAEVTAAPALADGTLFVPTAGGELVALAASGCGAPTCAPLWSAPAGSELTVQPAVAGGVVFTGSADGTLGGFAAGGCGAATCEPLWTAATGSRVTGAPAVSDGQLYVGTQDGRAIAYAPAPA
jgi:outer membrane protein assembly factor BamB